MKKLSVLIILINVLLISNNSYSQLPNQSTYLLKNLNQHTLNNYFYSAIWGYVAPNGREYALLGCPSGTAFIDVTDSANIHEVDFVTSFNNNWREMKTYSHYAYVVSEATNSGLQIIDLQYLPDSVSLVKTWFYTGYSRTHSISQAGHYLYLNGGNSAPSGGITILDVIDPENPVKLGQWTSMYVHDCRVINDTIYAANINDERVSIINATNKNAPVTVRTFSNLPGSGPHNTALSSDKKRLFVTDEIGTAPFRLKVWNIEDLNNITFVTAWQPTGITNSIVHNIETYANIAVVAHYSAGIRILNISNPDVPQEIAWYDTYPSNNNESYNGCWGVYMFPSGKIVASDRQTGFYCIKTNLNITSIPELITPANNSINNPNIINFKWNKINYANYYILEISDDHNFNNIIVSDTIIIDTTKLVKGFQDETKYYWRVRAKDSIGVVLTSAVWSFTTILPIYLDIKVLFEGMYYPLFNLMSRRDTVTAYLYQNTSPYNIVDSARSVIDSISFKGLFNFHNAKSDIYYIAVKHFNTIETWSKLGGESLINDGSIYNYDFTSSISNAYGNNLILRGNKYCLFSGDVNQDGTVDLQDGSLIGNDALNFISGFYLSTDINGDIVVDVSDAVFADNNGFNFVTKITP